MKIMMIAGEVSGDVHGAGLIRCLARNNENLDLIASKDMAFIYNNVTITNEKEGSLRADKIDYNFITEFYKVSMFNNKNVKIKIYE